MDTRKPTDYSAMYGMMDQLMGAELPQMELYFEIGRAVCARPEKGAAVMAAEYLQENYPEAKGFSPRNRRRMREFYRAYADNPELLALALKLGWTQNAAILEGCEGSRERAWYLPVSYTHLREMADALALDLVDKRLVTNQLVLTVGYDRENLDDPRRRQSYHGPVTTDRYGRSIPKHAVGTENFPYTSSANDLQKAAAALYDRIVDRNLLIRRLSISANKLLDEGSAPKTHEAEQLDLFTDYAAREAREQADEAAHARERKLQEAMLGIKRRYGKNAILKGMNLEEGATARERNQTIGGHQA